MDGKYAKLKNLPLNKLSTYIENNTENNMVAEWDTLLEEYWNALKKIWRDGDILVGYSQGGTNTMSFVCCQSL